MWRKEMIYFVDAIYLESTSKRVVNRQSFSFEKILFKTEKLLSSLMIAAGQTLYNP
jgi:hypothetical protein